MIRIAVNALPLLAVHTGIARYLKSLHAHIGKREDAQVTYVTLGSISAVPPASARQGGPLEKLLSLHPKLVYLLRTAQWLAYEKYASYVAARKGIDVFHESFYTPSNIARAATQVFTLHDLSLVKHPDTHSLDRRLFFERFFQSRLDQADHIIVPSSFIKDELCDYAGISETRVSVIHEGVDAHFHRRTPEAISRTLTRHKLPSEYLLFVGTLEPRKNLSVLLSAISRAKSDLPLVIIGWRGWGDPRFDAELQRLNLTHRVFFPGFVDDESLAALYSGATVFLYPSLYEGFGLPVLEAMACGCPVVCSDEASIPEVGGESVLYASPAEPDAWAQSIDSIVHSEELKTRLASAGKNRAALFSWQKAADRTMQLFTALK